MSRLNIYLGCLAVATVATLPLEASCQENARKLEKKLPYIEYVFGEEDEWLSYAFLGISRFQTDPPLAGVCHEYYLGATVIGAFSASADLQIGLSRSGPGFSLHWFPSEAIVISLRFDAIRREIVPSISFQADDK